MGRAVSSLSVLIQLLGSRSFTSLWYWLAFAGIWSVVTRNTLGIPAEVVLRARRGEDWRVLHDWLRLVLPHWRVGPVAGMVMTALCCFILTTLAVLGFSHQMEAAQALFLLLAPLVLLLVLRVRLALGLARLMLGAPGPEPVQTAARRIIRHGWVGMALSLLAIASASVAAAVWMARHPFGY